MTTAFLFSGQGSQHKGMGADLYETYPEVRAFYDNLDDAKNIKELSFKGSLEVISQTANTQPVMVAFQIAVKNILMAKGIKPTMTAGLSLGEYAALATAGVLEDKTAVATAALRGAQMQKASEGIDTAMVAVLGMTPQKIRDVLAQLPSSEHKAEIANINCPGQVVISGEKSRVAAACTAIKNAGARRLIPLNVSGPFHTSYMKPVGEALEVYFKKITFKEEQVPVVYNTLGRTRGRHNIADLMVRQVQSPIYFQDSLEFMISNGINTFIEIGFGGVLKGFVKKINKNIPVYEVNTVESIETYIKENCS